MGDLVELELRRDAQLRASMRTASRADVWRALSERVRALTVAERRGSIPAAAARNAISAWADLAADVGIHRHCIVVEVLVGTFWADLETLVNVPWGGLA